MWAGGAAYNRQDSAPLDPIDGTMIRHALRRRGAGKAREADGWGLEEPTLLPDAWLDALGRMMGQWKDEGAWPTALKQVMYSMIPKPKAEYEAGLRPIGLLPYVYRVWMAIRKSQDAQKQWLLDLHDGRNAAAATLAARTRPSIEVARHEGKHTLLAFLDCSTCYERVGHALDGERAAASGMQGRVADMVFVMYQGDRHVRAHGAVAQPRRGNHGLVAGCAFPKDILKAFLRPLKEECPGGRPRDYVGDTILQMQGDTTESCATQMNEQLDKLNDALRRGNMVLNDGTQQVLGLTKEVRAAWAP